MFWSSRASGLPRRLLIVAAAALVPVLAGCEAGDNAPTLDWHYPTDGAGTVVNGIAIRNMFVLGAPVTAAVTAPSLPVGHSAGLFFAMVNSGSPDRLLSVQAPGTATAVTLPGRTIKLGPSQAVLLTGPQPEAILTGLTRPLASGSVITVVLNFQKAGSVRLRVPVMARTQSYATFSPAPTPATKKHHHHSASPSASGSSSATPTTSPSASSTP